MKLYAHKVTVSQFEHGFRRAIALWKSGDTWEMISARGDYTTVENGGGMLAAIDAMSGWLDEARSKAKTFGVSAAVTEALIDEAKAA
jgi:hypothetical protein